MAVSIPRNLIDFVLLGPVHDRRQLQDSPVLGDVWLAFAAQPGAAVELLIAPHRSLSATDVAVALDERIDRKEGQGSPEIAALHGIVAAKLTFDEVLTCVVPMTGWWNSKRIRDQLKVYHEADEPAQEAPAAVEPAPGPVQGEAGGAEAAPAAGAEAPGGRVAGEPGWARRLNRIGSAILDLARGPATSFEGPLDEDLLPALDRYLALAGLILWARKKELGNAEEALQQVKVAEIVAEVMTLLEKLKSVSADGGDGEKLEKVYQVSLNRAAIPALQRSVPAVKGDAARRLFGVECSDIGWAVLDSGIRGDHPAFRKLNGKDSRVVKAFDFGSIRQIVSLDNHRPAVRAQRVAELLKQNLADPPTPEEADDLLARLADDTRNRRTIQWELVQRLVEIQPATPPASDHGTHVAGIIGASAAAATAAGVDPSDCVDGMCPDIQLYDFRVLAPGLRETEFAIIAALQFIRHLNTRTDYTTIHGANLSLSIPHDVRNYACGRTPICVECERLVESGVVVVAAAGNHGYQSYQTREGSFEGYAAYSITDPGNADSVITVGATHRHAPHTYGVSFFSSRGPTGDGRHKPDLVAPGERIRGPFREHWGDLDGTSMAAPHVSGAAAMLMARYSELIGQPRRIKTILCSSATDLGREKGFQGNGMLDVLRAFQSI
jgi:serine protease AprX